MHTFGIYAKSSCFPIQQATIVQAFKHFGRRNLYIDTLCVARIVRDMRIVAETKNAFAMMLRSHMNIRRNDFCECECELRGKSGYE